MWTAEDEHEWWRDLEELSSRAQICFNRKTKGALCESLSVTH